jgi:WD40 repeat protein
LAVSFFVSPGYIKRYIAINGAQQSILDLETGSGLPLVVGHSYGSVEFSADGALLVATYNDRDYDIFDTTTDHQVLALSTASGTSAIAFPPDNRTIATGFADGQVKLWQLATGQEVATFKAGSEPILKLQFSTDGRKLAAVARDKHSGDALLFIWRAEPPR